MAASAAQRDALDKWIRVALRDRKVHREEDLVTRWQEGPGAALSRKDASMFMHERLKSLEIGHAVVRAPGTDDGWWCPN